MENEDDTPAEIQLLPYDIIILILEYTSITDIVRFGATCKQFNELVKTLHGLWKLKLRTTLNTPVYNEIEKKANGNWFNEVKWITTLQSEVHARIIDMAAYYYRCNNDINLYEVRQFLINTFSNGVSYYCSIDILQGFLKKASKNTFLRFGNKPFTLTEMHYTKIAVQHLLHPYLTMKWVQAHHVTNELPPEFILNFFIQWVDPLKMHTDEEVQNVLNVMTSMVEKELKKIYPENSLPIQQQCANGDISELQIITAISQVVYKDKRMAPVSVANVETLDIVKVAEMGCGHDVVIGTIYSALAKRFEVRCELIAFPNHLYLEFRGSPTRVNRQVYKIDLSSGKLVPKQSCPFSRGDNLLPPEYCPDSLLHFVISAFLKPMGSYKTWYMQNAIYLLDFLSTNPNCSNKYKNYLPYLLDNAHLPVLATPIKLTSLTDEQLRIITLLSYLTKSSPPQRKEVVVKKRTSGLRFAVGMVMQHKIYNYLCVVRGWELGGAGDGAPARADAEVRNLQLREGPAQPFYNVVAIDQSKRFVPQEHLEDVPQPSRLYHLEEIIAKEFTHFNGFAYEPNVYKQNEYPDDLAISEHYRIRAENMYVKDLQE